MIHLLSSPLKLPTSIIQHKMFPRLDRAFSSVFSGTVPMLLLYFLQMKEATIIKAGLSSIKSDVQVLDGRVQNLDGSVQNLVMTTEGCS